jgi:hypothetical protein
VLAVSLLHARGEQGRVPQHCWFMVEGPGYTPRMLSAATFPWPCHAS